MLLGGESTQVMSLTVRPSRRRASIKPCDLLELGLPCAARKQRALRRRARKTQVASETRAAVPEEMQPRALQTSTPAPTNRAITFAPVLPESDPSAGWRSLEQSARGNSSVGPSRRLANCVGDLPTSVAMKYP